MFGVFTGLLYSDGYGEGVYKMGVSCVDHFTLMVTSAVILFPISNSPE